MDQFVLKPAQNQIRGAFHVNNVSIVVLFSAFIPGQRHLIHAGRLPSADRWNRTRAMAVTIVAWSIISALGGLVPTDLFFLLVLIRGSLGFGQAFTDPSGSSVIADFYGTERRGNAYSLQQCLSWWFSAWSRHRGAPAPSDHTMASSVRLAHRLLRVHLPGPGGGLHVLEAVRAQPG